MWETKQLGEVCLVRRGTTITKKQTVEGRIPVIGGGTKPTYFHNQSNREANCITVSGSGASAGLVNIWEQEIFASDCSTVEPKDKNQLHKFVYYYLLSQQQYIYYNFRSGAAQPHVYAKDIATLPFPIISIAEQQRIVEKMDRAFAEIDKTIAAAEANAKNADSLLNSLIEGTFRQQLDKWGSVKLSEVTELSRGHNPPKSKFIYEPKEGYVRFYQIRDGSSDDKAVYVPDSPQLHKVNKDDILMVAYRHVGRAFRGVVGAFNVALCKIKITNREILSDDYLFYLIPSSFVRGELLKQSERSLIPSMSINHLKEISIPLPPIDIQKFTVEKLNSVEENTLFLKKTYELKALNLDLSKQAILKQAFVGELV